MLDIDFYEEPVKNFKTKSLFYQEYNRRAYRILQKRYYANQGYISCSYCRYHKGENYRRYAKQKNWKNFRTYQCRERGKNKYF